jgi:hypothetical protein
MEITTRNGSVVLIDDQDFPMLQGYSVVLCNGYPAVKIRGEIQYLHRLVMGLSKGDKRQVDHVDLNMLDCRKSNLRLCTHVQNLMNQRKRPNTKSGYRGVYHHAKSGLWQARIRVEGKEKSLGYYKSTKEAHEAYKAAALEHHGEFANFG